MVSNVDISSLTERQFRLRTALLAVTACSIAFAFLRYLTTPVEFVLLAAVFMIAILCFVFFTAKMSRNHNRILGGVWGTIGGGAAFGVMMVTMLGPDGWLFPAGDALLVLTMATAIGAGYATLFVIFGILAARILLEAFDRDDVWTGAACGAVTGFMTTVFSAGLFFAFVPAIVGGLFGAFGSAIQLQYAKRSVEDWDSATR